MNPQEAKDYLQGSLPEMTVEVEENYSNQHAKDATRFIFTKGETKTNIMFKKGMKLDNELMSSVIEAIRKKFESVPFKEQVKETIRTIKEANPQEATYLSQSEPRVPARSSSGHPEDISYDLYIAAKHVVETYEREHPMT